MSGMWCGQCGQQTIGVCNGCGLAHCSNCQGPQGLLPASK
jgi:hypothetical protein